MDAPERPSRLELEKAWHNRLRRAFSQYQRNLEWLKVLTSYRYGEPRPTIASTSDSLAVAFADPTQLRHQNTGTDTGTDTANGITISTP